MAWIQAQDASDLHTSVISIGELQYGVLAVPRGARRAAIEAWLAEGLVVFGPRVLPIDFKVASVWAAVKLALRRDGKIVGAIDELIAATALVHDLTVITRNVRHFETSGCKFLSPWAET